MARPRKNCVNSDLSSLRERRKWFGCVDLSEWAEGEDGVKTSEGERVGGGEFWGSFSGSLEDDVEIDGGVDLSDSSVDGEEAVVEGEDGGEGFEGSAGS